jgi:hypothetical protein
VWKSHKLIIMAFLGHSNGLLLQGISSPLLGLSDYWPSRWLMISLIRKLWSWSVGASKLAKCEWKSPVPPLSKRRFRSMLGRYLLWQEWTKNLQAETGSNFWNWHKNQTLVLGSGTRTKSFGQKNVFEKRVPK